MARALYDNIAESPDELAFRRGDLLTVLEQNTGGSEGWWLCSLRGRQVSSEQDFIFIADFPDICSKATVVTNTLVTVITTHRAESAYYIVALAHLALR